MNLNLLFYLFAALMLLCGIFVVINRNPVNSAFCLLLTILSMAGLFVTLHAYFLAAVQVIVYAGAVMVLFVFVIMLMNLKEEVRRKLKVFITALGILSAAMVAFIFVDVLQKAKPLVAVPSAEGSTKDLGKILFSNYVLPFEILSLLLLVAMIGAIVLSKKELK